MLSLLRRISLAAAIALPLLAPSLAAQATRDQPMLTVGMVGGWMLGKQDFWHVPNQTILATDNRTDVFDIHRQLKGNLAFNFQATVYKSPYFGFGGEIGYLGIGTSDTCILAQASGYEFNRLACDALNRDQRSTSATAFLGTVVLRPWGRKIIQPYLRLGAGFSAITDNLVALTSYLGTNGGTVAPIYPSTGGLTVRPTGVVGLGLSIGAGTGYQLRIEGRQTAIQLRYVMGASERDQLPPPVGTKFMAFPSLLIGMDIVLERSRGRRY